ncbi:type II toxin-antitoxin system VapC family toxin [Mesorhizobium sp. B1-1-8]|uniref:type II toxin-antitoxin system VapC family toxin n=1 Tax=Mesorhizobium sp. B1-1-8 TaxID=2589976 RepID=UPI00112B4C80|nr:type II toxin-antitoxin system VapC family toxin [Mesorhizobium sp. B1-1-8]UCI09349.1 type II toxin-antitoxin system VapC family toxin [Mesorhizobium sp. B1-1-8]
MYLLDTNVISELRRRDRCDPNVRAWAESRNPGEFHVSAVSILEAQIGALRAERKDKKKGAVLRAWVDGLAAEIAERILPVDLVVVLRCAPLHVPDPKPDRDAYIAATALVNNLTVVTRNIRDFESTGVKLFNPWISAKD